MGEFDLIDRYFRRPVRRSPLGIGDDCALLAPAAGMQLAVSTDLLLEGRHFLSTAEPRRLGHKCLAVNLSDLAACGARPLAFTLALSLPAPDSPWLAGFSAGLLALADEHGCELVGGDTTRGPLSVCITVFGEVPAGQALLRSGARAGDDLWASGSLGDARLALEVFRGRSGVPAATFEAARLRLEQPQPRVTLGLALRGVASAAIDLSDGLAGDLRHLVAASGVGATLDAAALRQCIAAAPVLAPAEQLDLVLSGGDDYELCFTAPADRRRQVEDAAAACGIAVTRIGRIDAEAGLRLQDGNTPAQALRQSSFDHFA